ncbi:hypothetical protein [Piscinibacter koreensis]|uniref:Uncharacterized protein n=1 Tax=Piscinibacter koreensis TaxID=2742824 RepID=A0A7Y6TZ29_9BURK|nr:hypothetical protein [Schlegelella koreensis]NUZ08854.1 hypothetical protein [Schlegelella koreensis]
MALPAPAAEVTPPLSAKSACSETSRLNDRREFACIVEPAGGARLLRFEARFTGGHDDTSASIEPVLDEQPLQCNAGSKTRLFGEDGDVSLHCDFSAPPPGSQPAVFKVLVKWNHAEYADFDFGRR